MKHRATSPEVEALRAELIRRTAPYVRVEATLDRLLAAQDDATLDGVGGRTLGRSTQRPFDLEALRAHEGHDFEEAA